MRTAFGPSAPTCTQRIRVASACIVDE